MIDPMAYFFGPDAQEKLRGKAPRMTNEDPPRISLYDFIEIITDNVDPRTTWRGISDSVPEVEHKMHNWHFPGAGQRPTPVVTLREAVLVANHLRGPLADHMKRRNAELSIDVMGGNEAKVNELVGGIADFHKEGRAEGTLAALCRMPESALESALEPALEPAPDTNALITHIMNESIPVQSIPIQIANKFAIMSPTLKAMNLTEFANRELCYLLTFVYENEKYIKFGYTKDFFDRLQSHQREFPDVAIYYVVETSNCTQVETDFKRWMRCNGTLVDLKIMNKTHTEVLKNMEPALAEMELFRIVQQHKAKTDNELQKLKLQNELAIHQLNTDVAIHQLNTDVAIQRMELLKLLMQTRPELVTAELLGAMLSKC